VQVTTTEYDAAGCKSCCADCTSPRRSTPLPRQYSGMGKAFTTPTGVRVEIKYQLLNISSRGRMERERLGRFQWAQMQLKYNFF